MYELSLITANSEDLPASPLETLSTQPVLGSEFLLITGPDGTRLPRAAYDYVAQFITAEGEITKRGDLLVWEIDTDTIEVTE